MTKKVGYGSPPDHTKFKPGTSGNPKGRKKGSMNLRTDLTAELSETIQITENGKPKRITKQRALLKALTANGIKGDVRAAQLLLKWVTAIVETPEQSSDFPPLTREDRDIMKSFLERYSSASEDLK
jgi:hypothetical protein